MTQVEEILQKAKALIEKEENWTQGAYAEYSDGQPVSPGSGVKPARFCSLGAVYAACGGYDLDPVRESRDQYVEDRMRELADRAEQLLDEAVNGDDIITYNDRDDTDHSDVLRVFDVAIEAAKRV